MPKDTSTARVDVKQFNNDTFKDIIQRGDKPLIGVDAQPGFYKDKPIEQAGQGLCGILAWMRDNNDDIEMEVWMGFKWHQSVVEYRFYDRLTGDLLHTIGPVPVMGKALKDNQFPDWHFNVGFATVKRIAKQVDDKLKIEKPELLQEEVDGIPIP